jgi:TolA-binding protein
MKEISQRQLKPRFLPLLAEEKLNNENTVIIFKKASLIACLFYCAISSALGQAQELSFAPRVLEAYRKTLDLDFKSSSTLLLNGQLPEEKYVQNLNETLELLLSEDPSLFSNYEERFEERGIENPTSAVERFVAAEMNLHWAFVYLKFGQELDAASHFREAYKLAMEARKKFPDYMPIRKTTGLIQIMVGAVPDKYDWIMDLLGIHGSIESGLRDLQLVTDSNSIVALEARLIKSMIHGYVLQQPANAAYDLLQVMKTDSSEVFRFGAASLFVKASSSENAYNLLKGNTAVTPLQHYLFGEVLLHRGDYSDAVRAYQTFASTYRGKNNLKDAYYKMGVSYRLLGDQSHADSIFDIARKEGIEKVEADRSAARTLAANENANVSLLQCRYYTDGGYYEKAKAVLSQVSEIQLSTRKDKIEYYYRKARLEHGMNHADAAKLFYNQVIDMSGKDPWYFAPNACLQMGYIMLDKKDESMAKFFFRKALSYKNHEYKNSIDSKAKTALNRLKR